MRPVHTEVGNKPKAREERKRGAGKDVDEPEAKTKGLRLEKRRREKENMVQSCVSRTANCARGTGSVYK